MTLDEYQALAVRTAGPKCRNITNAAMGLSGEAGEFSEHVKKHVFHDHALNSAALSKELGDVLWYVALACEVLGVTMAEVAQANIAKLRARYPEGFSNERSVNRVA